LGEKIIFCSLDSPCLTTKFPPYYLFWSELESLQNWTGKTRGKDAIFTY